ncbi:hypothetical protein D3C73_1415540 [compost metagenome]
MIAAITNTNPTPATCEPLPKSGDALSMAVRTKITDRITPPNRGHRPRMQKWRRLSNRLWRKYQTQAKAVSE